MPDDDADRVSRMSRMSRTPRMPWMPWMPWARVTVYPDSGLPLQRHAAGPLPQCVHPVGPLPGQVELGATEVAVGSNLAVDRPPQVQLRDDGGRAQVEDIGSNTGELLVG